MFRERHSYSLRSGKITVISERTMLQDIAVVVLLLPVATTGLLLDSLEYRNCSTPLGNAPLDNEVSELASSHCPPWFTNETGECRPGPKLGGIIQQDLLDLQTSLQECHCMTEDNGALVVGGCMYTCKAVMGYYPLPCHVSQVNDFTCAGLHRRGKLCGMCEDGYAIPVYSYDLGCVKCDNYKYNWLKYLAVAFLPLTLFYILVTLFSISFTSPLLTGLVMAFQILGQPMQAQLFLSLAKSLIEPRILKALLSIASFWNLDFFRLYYSFCLHPDASAMAIMALDYATTVYPVILIGVTYVLVKLYDHNFKLLVWPWKLLPVFLKPIRRHWDVRTSLVDVFASFIYLSSTRLLVTSINFLYPFTSHLYQKSANGQMKLTTAYYLFNVPSLEFLSKNHLPFALLAISLSFIFFFLPMIVLFVYPFLWFQRSLNRFRLNSLTLRTFVDVFQGPFKDGTNGTKDYRYFSGCFLLIPLLINLTFMLTLSSTYYPLACFWILIYLTLHLVFRPYKRLLHNYIAIAMSSAFLAFHWSLAIDSLVAALVYNGDMMLDHSLNFGGYLTASIVLLLFAVSILFFYLLGLLCFLTIPRVCCYTRRRL